MKLTDRNFQTAVKLGALLLILSTLGNVYLLLRHREVYRDASRREVEVQQQGAVLTLQQQAVEGVLREFAARAPTEAGIAEIFQRRKILISTNNPVAAPQAQTP